MTSKALPPTSRTWWKDGPAGDTDPPESPSQRRTRLRTASADRQRQYATGQQPLAVVDELVACLRQTTATVRVPRWAIAAAITEVFLRVNLDPRRRGQNASLGAKAAMEATHRIRYEMVQKVEDMEKEHLREMVQTAEQMDATHRLRYEKVQQVEQRRFTGRLKWELAAALCGEPVASANAVEQSSALIKKNPSLGLLSATYVAASSDWANNREQKAHTLAKALTALLKKQAHSQR